MATPWTVTQVCGRWAPRSKPARRGAGEQDAGFPGARGPGPVGVRALSPTSSGLPPRGKEGPVEPGGRGHPKRHQTPCKVCRAPRGARSPGSWSREGAPAGRAPTARLGLEDLARHPHECPGPGWEGAERGSLRVRGREEKDVCTLP